MNSRTMLVLFISIGLLVSLEGTAAAPALKDPPPFNGYDRLKDWLAAARSTSDERIHSVLDFDYSAPADIYRQNADTRPCAASQALTLGSDHYVLANLCSVVPWTLVSSDPTVSKPGQPMRSRIQIKEFRPGTIGGIALQSLVPNFSKKAELGKPLGKLNGYILASVDDLDVPQEVAALPTIILMPPTGGENAIDDLYADTLSSLGFRVMMIQEWDRGVGYLIDPTTYDDDSTRSFWAIQRVVERIKADQTRAHAKINIGILGTSVGAILSSLAYGTLPDITSAVLIVAGGGLPDIIGESKQEGLSAIRAARMAVDTSLTDIHAYVKTLEKTTHVDSLHYTGTSDFIKDQNLMNKKVQNLYMIRGSADETVRTTFQEALYYLWQKNYADANKTTYSPNWNDTYKTCFKDNLVLSKNVESNHYDDATVPKLTCLNKDHVPAIEYSAEKLTGQITQHFCQTMMGKACGPILQVVVTDAEAQARAKLDAKTKSYFDALESWKSYISSWGE